MIFGITSLIYINTLSTNQNQLSLESPKINRPNSKTTKLLTPYPPELIIQDSVHSKLVEINTREITTKNNTTIPLKLKSKSIIASKPMPSNVKLEGIEDHIISSSGEISGVKIITSSNSDKNGRIAIVNGQKIPLNDIIDVDTDENNYKSHIPYLTNKSSNYYTSLNKSNLSEAKNHITPNSTPSTNYYHTQKNDSIEKSSHNDKTEVSKTNSQMLIQAKIGDERFIRRVKRKVRFPFDSISISEINLEVLIQINTNGCTKGIIVKADVPQSFIRELETAIKETTKWHAPTKNNKPIGGTRKIFLFFKND